MTLTDAQRKARDGKLTASRVGVLMTGDDAAVLNLWREMVGDPAWVEDDLSAVWPVQLGSHTETLNLDWYERKTGHALERGRSVTSPDLPWAAATLDGWDIAERMCVEAKHVNNWANIDDVIARYQPQLHWQMYVTQTERAALSVIIGASEPVIEIIQRDLGYMRELVSRAAAFWDCVTTLTPPVALPSFSAPVIPVREVEMQGSNEWASLAADWTTNKVAAKAFEASAKGIKAMVEPDVVRAFGHGIEAKRSRNGAITIKEISK